MTRCWYFDQVHEYFGFAPKNTPLSGDKVVLRPESGGEISLPADTDGSNRLHSMTVVRQSRNDYYGLSDVVRSCNLLRGRARYLRLAMMGYDATTTTLAARRLGGSQVVSLEASVSSDLS
jgi:hypothetical protein